MYIYVILLEYIINIFSRSWTATLPPRLQVQKPGLSRRRWGRFVPEDQPRPQRGVSRRRKRCLWGEENISGWWYIYSFEKY